MIGSPFVLFSYGPKPRKPFWSPRELAKYVHSSDLAWSSRAPRATFLGRARDPGPNSFGLALSSSSFIVSRGSDLEVFDFIVEKHKPRPARWAFRGPRIVRGSLPLDNIQGIAVMPTSIWSNPNQDVELCVARLTTLTRVRVLKYDHEQQRQKFSNAAVEVTAHYQRPPRQKPIQAFTASRNTMVTFSDDCILSLYNAAAPWIPPQTFSPFGAGKVNIWCARVSPMAPTPFVAFGGSVPLSLFALENFGSKRDAFAVLSDKGDHPLSVNSLCRLPDDIVSPPWGSMDQIIASGWYDGSVRFHDLRSDHRNKQGHLLPMLKLHDRTGSGGALYCLAIGGGGGTRVVGGRANHGIVSIWDLRNSDGTIYNFNEPSINDISFVAKGGWSIFPPESNWSSTHDLALEGSRIWGVGHQGPFLLDFSPESQLGRHFGTRYPIPTIYEHNVERSIVVNLQ